MLTGRANSQEPSSNQVRVSRRYRASPVFHSLDEIHIESKLSAEFSSPIPWDLPREHRKCEYPIGRTHPPFLKRGTITPVCHSSSSWLPSECAQAYQPGHPYSIQRLEVHRADVIHSLCAATEELANYLPRWLHLGWWQVAIFRGYCGDSKGTNWIQHWVWDLESKL